LVVLAKASTTKTATSNSSLIMMAMRTSLALVQMACVASSMLPVSQDTQALSLMQVYAKLQIDQRSFIHLQNRTAEKRHHNMASGWSSRSWSSRTNWVVGLSIRAAEHFCPLADDWQLMGAPNGPTPTSVKLANSSTAGSDKKQKNQKKTKKGDDEEQDDVGPSTKHASWTVFFSHIVATTVLVLLMCGDDLCWLLPFLAGQDKHSMAGFYIFCMCFMWTLAWSLYLVAKAVEVTHPSLPVEEISDVVSTLLLMGLTCKFFSEWYYDEEDADETGSSTEAEDDNNNNDNAFASVHAAAMDEIDSEKMEAKRRRRMTFWRLFLVSFGGNFDNVGVYIPIMLSGVFTPLELLIGDFLAACIIALITLGLSGFKVLTDFFTQVPLWVIVGLLTSAVTVNCGVTLAESTAF